MTRPLRTRPPMHTDEGETVPDNRPPGGPWTSHGHSIPGVTTYGSGRPPVYRCGGPKLCKACAADAERITEALARLDHGITS
jgi:hypothetical protein